MERGRKKLCRVKILDDYRLLTLPNALEFFQSYDIESGTATSSSGLARLIAHDDNRNMG